MTDTAETAGRSERRWTAAPSTDGGGLWVVHDEQGQLVFFGMDEETARTFAAAPDMLAALKEQLARLEFRKPFGFASIKEWAKACLASRSATPAAHADAKATLGLIAAIARAEGRAS